jgi:hypothetical protein
MLRQVYERHEPLAPRVLLGEGRLVDVLLDMRQGPAAGLAVGPDAVLLCGRADYLVLAEVLGSVEGDADVRGGEFQRDPLLTAFLLGYPSGLTLEAQFLQAVSHCLIADPAVVGRGLC